MNTHMMISGEVSFYLKKQDSRKLILRQENLVVALGEAYCATRLSSNSAGFINSIAAGTGTTPAVPADTALESQTIIDINPFGPVQGTATDANKITVTGNLSGDDWAGTITEAGLFSNTILFSRVILSVPVTLSLGEILEVVWTISFQGA